MLAVHYYGTVPVKNVPGTYPTDTELFFGPFRTGTLLVDRFPVIGLHNV